MDEDEIAQVIIDFQRAGFPITVPKLRILAWQYDHLNGINSFANNKEKKAGRTWSKFFLHRYPHIRVRYAVNLSKARAMAANEPNIKKWFKEYAEVLEKLHIESPEYIWSGDETGVQTVPREELYLGEVNEPLYSTVSAEQGETSTVLSSVNAVGRVCPPLVLHKGQRVQANWSDSMPHFIKLAATSKGYITKHQFHQYGIRFVQYLAKIGRLDRPHLLIIDSHKSHVYNLAFFNEMKENNIHVMAIPPHTSHILQPLDSTPFAQFKCNWQAKLLEWNFTKGAKVLANRFFFEVFWPAWRESMTVGNIQSSFRKTGIFPVNMSAIPKTKFAPAQVTDGKKIMSNSYGLQDFMC